MQKLYALFLLLFFFYSAQAQVEVETNADGSITLNTLRAKETYKEKLVREFSPLLRSAKAKLGLITSKAGGSTLSIIHVMENSPAERAGILEGDQIKYMNDMRVRSFSSYHKKIENFEPGDSILFEIVREGDLKEFIVIAEERSDFDPSLIRKDLTAKSYVKKEILAQQFLGEHGVTIRNRKDAKGVDVLYVAPESGMANAIQTGDIILAVYEKEVSDIESCTKALNQFYDGDKVVLQVVRNGEQSAKAYFIKL